MLERALGKSILVVLALGLGHTAAWANWEGTWRVGDTWTYRVQSVELPGPYTMLPYYNRYNLTMAVVAGEMSDPVGPTAPLWAWTVLVEHDRYGFTVSAKETAYVVEGVEVVRWPLPTLFLWFDANYRPEEGAARVGLRHAETEPTVWEKRTPIESGGKVVGEVIYRVTIESIGSDTVEVAGGLLEATGFRYRAETMVGFTGRKPTVRVHEGTAWGSDEVRNWAKIEGRETVDGRVVREYHLELISFSPGAGT